MVIINDLVLKKSTPYVIPSEDKYINLAINQNYLTKSKIILFFISNSFLT